MTHILICAVANGRSNNIIILFGQGDGSSLCEGSIKLVRFRIALAVADLNNDDYNDIVVANYLSGNIIMLFGQRVMVSSPLRGEYETGANPRSMSLC